MKKNIKVNKKIKPIHFKNRTIPDLIIGEDYFVSFGCNVAEPCKLLSINEGNKRLDIEVYTSKRIKRNTIYFHEIGKTPEESVINEVTL